MYSTIVFLRDLLSPSVDLGDAMKTGEEIHGILGGLVPDNHGDAFVACPLHRAGADCSGNPSADLASYLLGWPLRICQAIADAFDCDGRWPGNLDARTQLYHERFAVAINAGRRECLEFDTPGSAF